VRPEAWEAFPGEGTNNTPAYHLQAGEYTRSHFSSA